MFLLWLIGVKFDWVSRISMLSAGIVVPRVSILSAGIIVSRVLILSAGIVVLRVSILSAGIIVSRVWILSTSILVSKVSIFSANFLYIEWGGGGSSVEPNLSESARFRRLDRRWSPLHPFYCDDGIRRLRRRLYVYGIVQFVKLCNSVLFIYKTGLNHIQSLCLTVCLSISTIFK